MPTSSGLTGRKKKKSKGPSAPRRQGKLRTARDKKSQKAEAKKRHDRMMKASGRSDLAYNN